MQGVVFQQFADKPGELDPQRREILALNFERPGNHALSAQLDVVFRHRLLSAHKDQRFHRFRCSRYGPSWSQAGRTATANRR